MAYAQLTAAKVREAADRALQDLRTVSAGDGSSSKARTDIERLEWLFNLSAAAVREDETYAFVTVTAEDFTALAKHYHP